MECKICGRKFEKSLGLAAHIQKHGITLKSYYDMYMKKDFEGKCKICGKDTKFKGLRGYSTYCSSKCVWSDESIKKKRKLVIDSIPTNIRNEWAENRVSTNKSKNNGKVLSEFELKKRNYASISNISSFLEECDCSFVSVEYNRDKIKYVNYRCNVCGKSFRRVRSFIDNHKRFSNHNLCNICNYSKSSNTEKEIYEYIKTFYTGNIAKNDRTILRDRHELDLVCDNNIAIEVDGVYWHNESRVSKTYHLKKTEECEAKGIHLIHIFDTEWNLKRDIVKSRLRGLFGYNDRIYARKCIVKLVNYADSKKFLEDNHLQGNCISKYRYGLYYNSELVAIMTFGSSRFKKDETELLRFCNKKFTNVIGGASRLLKHFLKEHNVKLVSYADRRWSIGNLYEKLGFKLESISKPNYYYLVNHKLESRLKFQKHKLVLSGNNNDMSEHEIMLSQKIYRVYDCGMLKYII